MSHFYLPKLDSKANITVPRQPAHWHNNAKKVILGISDGIIIDEHAVTRGVSSIPDIWARPLLFQSAIRPNSKHPLRKRCLQEWRGLLSLLALHKIKPELADFEVIPVSLDSETFSTALINLAPKNIQLEQDKFYQWTDILMIRFGGIPLGAFSPTTLIYSGADYNSELLKLPFPFKDEEGYLVPPETKEDGIEYVGEWLYNLQKKINTFFYSDQKNPDHQIIGTINELIDSWLKEIRQKTGYKEDAEIDVKKYKVSEDAIEVGGISPFLNEYKIFELLLHPLREDTSFGLEIPKSDVLLQSSRTTDKEVVVITEKLLSEPINIWRELRPKSLGENPKEIIDNFFKDETSNIINNIDIGVDNGFWIRPELFFLSNKLIKSRGVEILNAEEEEFNISTKYILPFRKEILNFFSPQEIKEKLKPAYKEDSGVIKFSFYLPVGNKEIKVEKTYKSKITQPGEGEIEEITIPVVDIFPNYLGINWKKYFLFQGNAEAYNIKPLLYNNDSTILSREREYKKDARSQTVRIYQTTGDNSFPEGIEICNSQNIPMGLILLDRIDQRQGLKHHWKVGIDFGTSNTNVYLKTDTSDVAESWQYNFPEYYRSVTNSDPELRTDILEEYFFPTRKIKLPIPTTLKMYNLALRDSMVLDYFIYHPIEYKFPENVLSDIKWDGEGERKTEYFLESLLFLILIEIVKNGVLDVQLGCSYPKAFSETNINVFKREWESVFEKLLKPDTETSNRWLLDVHGDTADDNDKKIKIHKPVFVTEGIAAGEYFANEYTIPNIHLRANKEIAAICLDVGGSTTDISIWFRNNIEFDASVLLAGKEISSLIQKNNRVRELLFSKNAAIALEDKKNEPAYFSARLNLILQDEEKHIINNLVKYANNKDIQWLRQIIALEFAALSYYTAQLCIATDERINGLLKRISEDGICLHWGGNAAKLLNWIEFGEFDPQGKGIASKMLNSAFYYCLYDKALKDKSIQPKSLGQLPSPRHKAEASGGLVVMNLDDTWNISSDSNANSEFSLDFEIPDFEEGDQIIPSGIVSGENLEFTDKTEIVPFYLQVANSDFFGENRTKLVKTTLERLTRFVNIFNFIGIKFGLFTEDTKIDMGYEEKRIIKDGVLKQFIRMQSLRESQRVIEPVFIMETKLLLDIVKSKIK
ncbi:MAG: hypothetical protein K8R53_01255 [Bacteroidales bacterium]|nr:hypothetical protein [Bacteroidales bacterium]